MCRRSTDLPSLITMSWDCFCDKFGCDVPGLPRPQCQAGQRTDYPECGLTLFTSGGFGPVDSVFDSSGRLVGQSVYSDTSYYACPDDPVSRASVVRGGQFPVASCRAVACDPCYAGTFPCPPR